MGESRFEVGKQKQSTFPVTAPERGVFPFNPRGSVPAFFSITIVDANPSFIKICHTADAGNQDQSPCTNTTPSIKTCAGLDPREFSFAGMTI